MVGEEKFFCDKYRVVIAEDISNLDGTFTGHNLFTNFPTFSNNFAVQTKSGIRLV